MERRRDWVEGGGESLPLIAFEWIGEDRGEGGDTRNYPSNFIPSNGIVIVPSHSLCYERGAYGIPRRSRTFPFNSGFLPMYFPR